MSMDMTREPVVPTQHPDLGARDTWRATSRASSVGTPRLFQGMKTASQIPNVGTPRHRAAGIRPKISGVVWPNHAGGWPLSTASPPFANSGTDVNRVAMIVEKIKAFVFQRRVRAKEKFMDFDPLRSGRCTAQQFLRGLHEVAPIVPLAEAELLSEYFTDKMASYPQVVSYKNFCSALDEVFALAELESTPLQQVPLPGATLQRGFASPKAHALQSGVSPFTATWESAATEEGRFKDLLHKLALLVKTRRIVFRTCFQDCERSNSTSLVTPRYSGKVTSAQFRQHFPFVKDFSEDEMDLLVKRYTTDEGDIHFLALDKDLVAVELEPALFIPQRPPVSGRPTLRSGRRLVLPEDPSGEDVIEKLRTVVMDRRLRLNELFHDFDKLRQGVCPFHQVKTVFTVLRIALEPKEMTVLHEMYMNDEGMFRYRDFCKDIGECIDGELPPQPGTQHLALSARRGQSAGAGSTTTRQRLNLRAQNALDEIEIWIRKRVTQRDLPLKRTFQDFDRVCSGRVTRSQFHRIMDMLNIDLSEAQVEAVSEAYCDTEKPWEFRYLDFCASVEAKPDWMTTPQKRKIPSKYFNRVGEIMAHPLSDVPRPITV
eukprot:TRINITY_DN55627_c0_g1_i1.p1 TRINITY_DN55627_c0_g1~~TRINITY_DN55627_c0_g1_i1.p1  ORF type:complete len:599 (-),score=78.67 TRINITY_DN55627_c0_g1_i1:161-1957(-)